nr:MFS transporter [Deinobacterium chartae]
MVFVGDGFMNATVVLAAFAAKLGASNAIIGLLPAIQQGGWMLPQLIIAGIVRAHPYKLPVYRSAATIRALTYVWMVLSSALLIDHPGWLLASFIAGMIINAFASGVSGLPFLEVVSKVIPSERRASFFGTRNLWGGLLAFLAGLGVRQILASDLPFPYNYTLIFAIGTVAYTVGYAVFGRVTEPPDEPLPRASVLEELRLIPFTLRSDPAFRAFLGVRLLLAFATMAEPFYAVYALRVLEMPASMLGVFLMTLTGVAPLSNVIWTRVAQRHGSRRIIRYSAFFAALAPIIALALPPGARWSYLAVFVCSSVATQGFNLGHTNHLLNIAPTHARSRYIGVLNTLVGLALFAPVIGGLLADAAGYNVVFLLSSGLFCAAWFLAMKLRRDA